MTEGSPEASFLRDNFVRYYRAAAPAIQHPTTVNQREFGFTFHNREGMQRHMGFNTLKDLQDFVAYSSPSNAYHSAAYYEHPDNQEMMMKGWLGGDLTFDIDADHVPTTCKPDHDIWLCLDCKAAGKGSRPETCPKCHSKRLRDETWVCDTCIGVTKTETIKLVEEFLSGEMGIPKSDVEIRFSGHRGFHIYVVSSRVKSLDHNARREIGDYVRGVGLTLDGAGLQSRRGQVQGPDLSASGWRGRVSRGLYALLQRNMNDAAEHEIRLTSSTRRSLRNRSEQLLKGLEEYPSNWAALKGSSRSSLENLVSQVAIMEGCKIDQLVTQDVHRLMRLPGSLHGKTGFIVKRVDIAELDKFNPVPDAVAFSEEETRVGVKRIPKLKMGETSVGPAENEVLSLPKYLAIYLLSKQQATLTST